MARLRTFLARAKKILVSGIRRVSDWLVEPAFAKKFGIAPAKKSLVIGVMRTRIAHVDVTAQDCSGSNCACTHFARRWFLL
jgi:hypothetical protein